MSISFWKRKKESESIKEKSYILVSDIRIFWKTSSEYVRICGVVNYRNIKNTILSRKVLLLPFRSFFLEIWKNLKG